MKIDSKEDRQFIVHASPAEMREIYRALLFVDSSYTDDYSTHYDVFLTFSRAAGDFHFRD